MAKEQVSRSNSVDFQKARQLAVTCLSRVMNDRVALDALLDQELATKPFSQAERDWLREVTAGVLRWKSRLDLAIDSAVSRNKPTGRVRRFLLIAAYQLIAQDRVPPAWVVSETVDAIKLKEGEKAASFANAVLRRISDTRDSWRNLEFPGEAASATEQATWACLPEWMWYRLRKQHGLENARKFAEITLTRPVFWLSEKGSSEPKLWSSETPLVEDESLASGAAMVQDLSSQTVLTEVWKALQEKGWSTQLGLDLCAAPGGKSVGLAWRGANVIASDLDTDRMIRLKQNIQKLAPQVKVLTKDEWKADRTALSSLKWVWVDAPCTSSGIVRKHPDIKWVREEKELQTLAKQQTSLLDEGLQLLGTEGALIYSVCSVFREEGSVRVSEFLKSHPELRLEREWIRFPVDGDSGDGFYAAFLVKS